MWFENTCPQPWSLDCIQCYSKMENRPAKAHHFNHYLGVNNYWARRLRIPQNLEEGLGICVQIQSNPNQILEELFKAFASGCPWRRCEHGWGVIPPLLVMEFCCIFCSWEAGPPVCCSSVELVSWPLKCAT